MDMRIFASKQMVLKANKRVNEISRRLKQLAEQYEGEYKPPVYTGWYVLLKSSKNAPSGYEVLGIYSPDNDEPEPQWDYALPIESSDTIKEFTGW